MRTVVALTLAAFTIGLVPACTVSNAEGYAFAAKNAHPFAKRGSIGRDD
ncbi:hypothetical protein DEA8626_03958 [Defluviimonas aquaemixtae]|uniref:Uncharacterized protein n=1 Tax=Albidovulum aquaemixtae TaxID=1542388 RepID=A0A2R8BNC4_9RHOB|nr:hypothetical protein [Defluviimonas aquaemixtae]SPH24925.1 hypothetical protein DEA8626_03958 [Defluviimonas aquaemixtae]